MEARNNKWRQKIEIDCPPEGSKFGNREECIPEKVVYSNIEEHYSLACYYRFQPATEYQLSVCSASFLLCLPFEKFSPAIEQQLRKLGGVKINFMTKKATVEIGYSDIIDQEIGKMQFAQFIRLIDALVDLNVMCDSSTGPKNILTELCAVYLNDKSEKAILREAQAHLKNCNFGLATELVKQYLVKFGYFEPIGKIATALTKDYPEFSRPLLKAIVNPACIYAEFGCRWIALASLALAKAEGLDKRVLFLEKALLNSTKIEDSALSSQVHGALTKTCREKNIAVSKSLTSNELLAKLKKYKEDKRAGIRQLGSDIWSSNSVATSKDAHQKPNSFRRNNV